MAQQQDMEYQGYVRGVKESLAVKASCQGMVSGMAHRIDQNLQQLWGELRDTQEFMQFNFGQVQEGVRGWTAWAENVMQTQEDTLTSHGETLEAQVGDTHTLKGQLREALDMLSEEKSLRHSQVMEIHRGLQKYERELKILRTQGHRGGESSSPVHTHRPDTPPWWLTVLS